MSNQYTVKQRGAGMWFLLAFFLLVITGLSAAFPSEAVPEKDSAVSPPMITGAAATGALLWGLFGTVRSVEFSDSLTLHHLFRSKKISWNQVKSVSFREEVGRLKTGIPFVSVPVAMHTMEMSLDDDTSYQLDIDSKHVEKILEVVRANT